MKEDWTDICLDDLRSKGVKVSVAEMEDTACAFCKRSTCVKAQGGASMTWMERMETQVDRLLKHPRFADKNDPQFAAIAKVKFKEMYQEAYRLEASRGRADWSIPQTPDAGSEPRLLVPKHFQPGEDTDHDPSQGEGIVEPPEEPKDPLPPRHKNYTAPKQGNTDAPQGGIVVGGLEPKRAVVSPAPVVTNPWAIPAEKKVEVGGTIRMGGGSSSDQGEKNECEFARRGRGGNVADHAKPSVCMDPRSTRPRGSV